MEAAGFILDGQSDILRNPEDDLTKIVFTPELRGKTDRFIMRFKSPD
jgi:predicted methyltransferase